MVDSFHMDADDLDRLSALVQRAPVIAHEEITTGMRRSVLIVEGDAKRGAPVRTGTLRRSLTSEVRELPNGASGRVGTNVPYAKTVEEGRGPVVARNAKVLRFTIGNQTFYRKRVGPAKGKPYLRPALSRNLSKIRQELGVQVGRRIVSRLKAGS